jgi:hypothetical protein
LIRIYFSIGCHALSGSAGSRIICATMRAARQPHPGNDASGLPGFEFIPVARIQQVKGSAHLERLNGPAGRRARLRNWALETMACMDELHWSKPVNAGTLTGIPFYNAATREVLGSSLRWVHWSKITSPTWSLPMLARFRASPIGKTARWWPATSLNPPPKSPMADLAPLMM